MHLKHIRMLGLIWPAMAAAMLPAGARPANASPSQPVNQQHATHQDTARPEKSEKALLAAPVCDVWDGHAARMVTGRPEAGRNRACPESQCPAHMATVPFAVGLAEPDCIDTVGASEFRASASGPDGLVCRYAHAPPSRF
jgi:hypothetical protein